MWKMAKLPGPSSSLMSRQGLHPAQCPPLVSMVAPGLPPPWLTGPDALVAGPQPTCPVLPRRPKMRPQPCQFCITPRYLGPTASHTVSPPCLQPQCRLTLSSQPSGPSRSSRGCLVTDRRLQNGPWSCPAAPTCAPCKASRPCTSGSAFAPGASQGPCIPFLFHTCLHSSVHLSARAWPPPCQGAHCSVLLVSRALALSTALLSCHNVGPSLLPSSLRLPVSSLLWPLPLSSASWLPLHLPWSPQSRSGLYTAAFPACPPSGGT